LNRLSHGVALHRVELVLPEMFKVKPDLLHVDIRKRDLFKCENELKCPNSIGVHADSFPAQVTEVSNGMFWSAHEH
jgi:hypothetical protein